MLGDVDLEVAGASTSSFHDVLRPSTLWAVRWTVILPGIDRDVDARVVRVPQVGLVRDVVGAGRVEGQARVAGLVQVDAAGAVVEGVGRGDAVFLDDPASWPWSSAPT